MRFIQTDHENIEEMWTDLENFKQEDIEKRVPTKITLAGRSHPWTNGHKTDRRKNGQRQIHTASATGLVGDQKSQ